MSLLPEIQYDEHLGRFLLLTLVVTVVLTGGEILGVVLGAAFLSLGLLVLYTAIQGLRYGYLEGKLAAAN